MSVEIKKIANNFLHELEERKKRTVRTVAHYNLYLQRFINWLKETGITDFEQIDSKVLENYKSYLANYRDPIRKTFLNKSTLNYYLIAVRGLLEYAMRFEQKKVHYNDVKLAKISKEPLSFIKKDELVLLLEAPNEMKQEKIITLRDKAILEILFCTGFKVSEIAQAQREQIKEFKKDKLFFCKQKNRIEVQLSYQATAALQKYLMHRKDKNKFLFIGHDNAAIGRKEQKPLSARSVERMIERYARYSGIKKRVTPQIIRNTYLVNKFIQGEDPSVLKEELGFKNINTVKEYYRKF